MGHVGFAARVGLVALVLAIVHHAAASAGTVDPSEPLSLSRIYGTDQAARELVQDGMLRSATITRLVQVVARSDWYVVVQVGTCPGNATLYGCLAHVVSPFRDGLALRLFINPKRGPRDDVLGTLGHELQHAVEVIQAGVRDTAGMTDLFRSIGTISRRGVLGAMVYETEQAERVTSNVRKELRAANAALMPRAR